MYILDVIPLTILPPQVPQILSYFSDRALKKGAVVRVAIHGRFVMAVVVQASPLENNKLLVKKSSFELKPIAHVVSEAPLVSDRQLRIAQWIASTYYTPLGVSLKTALPPFFAKRGYQKLIDQSQQPTPIDTPSSVYRASAQETPECISSLLKGLSKKAQILILTPDSVVARAITSSLHTHKPKSVHSGISNKELAGIWKSLQADEPQLIIGTRIALFLPFSTLAAVIIEDPDHEFYKSDNSPRYDATALAEKIAHDNNARCIYLTSSIGVRFRAFPKQFSVLDSDTKNSPSVIDMGREIRAGNFSLFSRDVQETLRQANEKSESVLLYSSRKAYAALVVCKTCGYIIPCANCSAPMRLHHTPTSPTPGKPENMLVCYHCLAYQQLPKSCSRCHNVNFIPAGRAGSQQIRDEYKNYVYNTTPPLIFDGDLIRTPQHEQEALEAVKKQEASLVIATSLILHHRYDMQFDHVIVVDADALLSNPDFRTEERFLALVQKLHDFQPRELLCQTHNPEWNIFQALIDDTKWFHDEIKSRQDFGYPPFMRIAKLSFRHTDYGKAILTARQLAESLSMVIKSLKLHDRVQILGPIPALLGKENNRYIQNIVLKIDPKLSVGSILKFVPSPWLIDVDPRTIV